MGTESARPYHQEAITAAVVRVPPAVRPPSVGRQNHSGPPRWYHTPTHNLRHATGSNTVVPRSLAVPAAVWHLSGYSQQLTRSDFRRKAADIELSRALNSALRPSAVRV